MFNLSAICSTLRKTVSQHGVKSAVLLTADRVARRLCRLHVQQVVWLDPDHAKIEASPNERYVFRFLEKDELNRFQADSSLDLDAGLTKPDRPGRHVCFGVLDGERLANYGWYALGEVEPEHVFGVGMKLPPDVAYMYKGFTHPDYRGQRLHALAMARALLELSQQGIRGLISTVEWTNFASLKSCDRLGYQRAGHITQWSFCGRRCCRLSKFPAQVGVQLIPPRTPPIETASGQLCQVIR